MTPPHTNTQKKKKKKDICTPIAPKHNIFIILVLDYIYIIYIYICKMLCVKAGTKCCWGPIAGGASYKAATVSPLVVTCGGPVVVEDDTETSFLEAIEHFSTRSSRFICFCRHSRLQKALSPLHKTKKPILLAWSITKHHANTYSKSAKFKNLNLKTKPFLKFETNPLKKRV